MKKSARPVYSLRTAKHNLLSAIRNEIASARGLLEWHVGHSTIVFERERAIRDLIASARAEKGKK